MKKKLKAFLIYRKFPSKKAEISDLLIRRFLEFLESGNASLILNPRSRNIKPKNIIPIWSFPKNYI